MKRIYGVGLVGMLLVGCASKGVNFEPLDSGKPKTDAGSGMDSGATPDSCTGGGTTWFRDRDGDGYGAAYDPASNTAWADACGPGPQDGQRWVLQGGDCADQDPLAHPGATPQKGAVAGAHPNTGAYDFNCDGSEKETYSPNAVFDCQWGGNYQTNCITTPGWRLPQDGQGMYCGTMVQGPWVTKCPPIGPNDPPSYCQIRSTFQDPVLKNGSGIQLQWDLVDQTCL